MNKDYLIQLTFRVYELSGHLPDKELLKSQIRTLANSILTDLIVLDEIPKVNPLKSRILKNISLFEENLNLARFKRLIDREDFLFLKKEYGKIRVELERTKMVPEEPKPGLVAQPKTQTRKAGDSRSERSGINQRQGKILEILKEKDKIQVQDLKNVFPGISKRTLRRDFDGLLKKGLISRVGEWNNVSYKISETAGTTGVGHQQLNQ